ncbi:alpha/beta hydrolase [Sporosarcina sp.]|uniref:alpha/beta hydrolase family protein n=1 Tax=Sporosarcina sp. TaxID=49982 RepID=UPI00262EF2CD|nr:alpha/beta hydrolase [Sporosarcina sp.]
MQVKELEITLAEGARIYGELDSPQGNGPWKTVILFHGSGSSDRHATVEAMGQVVSRNFDLISESLVQAGYAVFRYDKRESYDINIIIQDAREVVKYVSGLSDVSEILFYGWSEGVRVCATLVSEFPETKALLLQSGIAEGWSSYFAYILRELTVEKFEELDKNNDGILEVADFANCMPDFTSLTFSLYLLVFNIDKDGSTNFNKELDPEQKGSFSIKENWMPLADEIVADPTTLIRFAENAPGETWTGILEDIKKIQIPMLVLHGLNDGWISPVESVQIAKVARNHADVVFFKGLGHALSKVVSPLKDEGGVMEEEAITAIVDWLKKNIG